MNFLTINDAGFCVLIFFVNLASVFISESDQLCNVFLSDFRIDILLNTMYLKASFLSTFWISINSKAII